MTSRAHLTANTVSARIRVGGGMSHSVPATDIPGARETSAQSCNLPVTGRAADTKPTPGDFSEALVPDLYHRLTQTGEADSRFSDAGVMF